MAGGRAGDQLAGGSADGVGVPAEDWRTYRKCPVCAARTGQPCIAQSGRVIGGQTDGVRTELGRAHLFRKRRKRFRGL